MAVIRYVLAVVVLATILSVSLVAVEYTETERAHSEVETAVHQLDSTAVELYESEPLPERGQEPPQRVVTLSLPSERVGSTGVDTFTVESGHNEATAQVEYKIGGGNTQTQQLSVPVLVESGGLLDLSDSHGEVQLLLTLIEHEGERIVLVSSL